MRLNSIPGIGTPAATAPEGKLMQALISHNSCCDQLEMHGHSHRPLVSQGRRASFRVGPPITGPSARFARKCQGDREYPARFAGSSRNSAHHARSQRNSTASTMQNEFSDVRFTFDVHEACRSSMRTGQADMVQARALHRACSGSIDAQKTRTEKKKAAENDSLYISNGRVDRI